MYPSIGPCLTAVVLICGLILTCAGRDSPQRQEGRGAPATSFLRAPATAPYFRSIAPSHHRTSKCLFVLADQTWIVMVSPCYVTL